ncbi:uncharacterized protein LOC130719508 [Lotus japonicus]|uniref:uncharacterized protein LOC130719508 n=1 Tax=Lotus japonicus TaxID=34305 RepID=UPI002588B29B|nr:uncharacterized protein LOC130719508 [Lotus japonicus]
MPILFPCLLSELIVKQHPHVVRVDEPQGKRPMLLKFDYRLFAGTHVPDIVLSAVKGSASTNGTQAVGASTYDVLAELRDVSKSLDVTIQACKIRKRNVDKLIKAMTQVPAAGAEEGNIEESTENVEDDNANVEEEEAQYETAREDDDESDRENEESTAEEKEDVTGSTSSSPRSTSL